MAFGFGNDGDFRAGRVAAEFVRVHLKNRREQFRCDVAELQNDVALGGRAVAEREFSGALDFQKPGGKFLAMPDHALFEWFKTRDAVEAEFRFLAQEFFDHRRRLGKGGIFVRDSYGKAAAVAVVELNVENFQPELVGQPFDLLERVVFQMLVADRVVGVDLEHERQIALL